MSLKRKAADLTAEAAKKPKSNASITSFFAQPKSNAGSSPPSSGSAPATQPTKFDKDAWVAKLTTEQKDLLKLEIGTLHESVSLADLLISSPQLMMRPVARCAQR